MSLPPQSFDEEELASQQCQETSVEGVQICRFQIFLRLMVYLASSLEKVACEDACRRRVDSMVDHAC